MSWIHGTRTIFFGLLAAVVLGACQGSSSASRPPVPEERTEEAVAQEKRLAAFKAQGARVPLTVFPVLIGDKPMREAADAMGLVLEQKAGLVDVSSSSTAFEAPPESSPEVRQALFGEFVRKGSAPAGYALLAEFLVAPEARKFEEVRVTVVDGSGDLVWADRQRSRDPEFRRIAPDEPLEACLLVSERLRGLLELEAPGAPVEGRMQRLWAEKSGLPSREEQEAMRERLAALRRSAGDARVATYPVRVAGELDAARGASLAQMLGERGVLRALADTAEPALGIEASTNEQKVLWDLARGFKAHLEAHPPEGDYALLAEYLMDSARGRVGAVHFVLCTRAGEWVIVDYQNSHHADFRAEKPASAGDCDRLVARRLEGYLR